MGFCLVSISLMVLVALIINFKRYMINPFSKPEDYRILFEAIAGYGLGGSSVALFCRVGGGIYTKAADVGADLVAKLEYELQEDDPRNPACIADNVGDNVGDIAGMGSDLFGSLAESTCAALLVASTSEDLINTGGYYYPLLITAAGILACAITTIIAFITAKHITEYSHLENAIKNQMIISTVLMIPFIAFISFNFLPPSYNIGEIGTVTYKEGVSQVDTMICTLSGLISGMIIGIITEYYTSMSYGPVLDLVYGCKQGAAINVILGLALGYLSNVLPTFFIAGTVYTSYRLGGMFGIALAAIGMLGNLSVCLAIDGYGPISDNAGGLATMCELDPRIREITDDLDAAGNTTAAIGKGFAIGSACLVAFALYGAFITRTNLAKVKLNSPIVFSGLLIGAMIPYLFSALTMKAVGNAAQSMVAEIRKEFSQHWQKPTWNTFVPNTNECINIATRDSLGQMFLPGILVIFIPITTGVLFGPKAVAGLLIGIIISGIQMATSSANTGGAWDNCKKFIKSKITNKNI
jgi:inorganic pyrophosphatase